MIRLYPPKLHLISISSISATIQDFNFIFVFLLFLFLFKFRFNPLYFSIKDIIIYGFYPFFSFKGIYHESISFKILFNLLRYFIGFIYYPLIVFLFIIKFIYVEIKTNHHSMFLMSYFIIVITRFVDRSLPRAGFVFQCKKRMLV